MFVSWQSVTSSCFSVNNGVKQGGILLPYLFRFYIRDIIRKVNNTSIGCTLHNRCFNLLACYYFYHPGVVCSI